MLTSPSKLGFQVEVTLLEDHRLPIGPARLGFKQEVGCGPHCFSSRGMGPKWR